MFRHLLIFFLRVGFVYYDVLMFPLTITDSCLGRCWATHDRSRSCQCDSTCKKYGDCCADHSYLCQGGTAHFYFSCKCGKSVTISVNFSSFLPESSENDRLYSVCWRITDLCEGRCWAGLDLSRPCQCNAKCVNYDDCCVDFAEVCQGDIYNYLRTNVNDFR